MFRWWMAAAREERGAVCPAPTLCQQPNGLCNTYYLRPSGRPPRVSARVDAVLGDPFAPRSFSLIAIHKHGLRDSFRDEAIAELPANLHEHVRQAIGEGGP